MDLTSLAALPWYIWVIAGVVAIVAISSVFKFMGSSKLPWFITFVIIVIICGGLFLLSKGGL